MPYAISLKCLNDTASPILRIWDEASSFEVSASMANLNYPPHLTLAIFPDRPGHVGEVLENLFASQPTLSVFFEDVGTFENDVVVLWARPRHNASLVELHEKLHRHFDPASCDEHYRPGRWVPHCSLATKVPPSAAKAAMEWARQKRLDFPVEFDAADFVSLPPVLVEREYRLG